MNILIYGAGSVGLAVGSCLIKSGKARVTFLTRHGGGAVLREQGLIRAGIFGDYHAAPKLFSVVEDAAQIAGQSFDYILVCAQTFESETVAKTLAAHKITSLYTVLFHNGWGSSDIFARHLPRQTTCNGSIMSGFRRTAPNKVDIVVHANDAHIGSLYDNATVAKLEPLTAAIRDGGLPCKTTDDIQAIIWSKMLFNCTLNPLGALLGVKYGLLGDSEPARTIMNRVMDEIYAVMAHHGFHAQQATAAAYQEAFYGKMIPAAYAHESSMLQAIRAGRPTETDFLCGAISALGRKAGISTPTNDTLHEMLQFMGQKPHKTLANRPV